MNPLVVVWRITEKCGLDCAFCEYRRGLSRSRRSADPAQVLAFGARLAEHSRTAKRPVLVSWMGGEPLDWRPLAALAEKFKGEYGLQLGVTSNGARLGQPALRRHLCAVYDQVTISIDGLEHVHDALRGQAGLFERLRRGVSALAEERRAAGRGPRLRVNTILMRSTIPHFESLCRTVAAWGVDEVTFNTLGGSPGDAFYERERLTAEHTRQFQRDLPAMRQRLAAAGVDVRGSAAYLGRLHSGALGIAVPGDACLPGRDYLFVDERGRVGPCSFTLDSHAVPLASAQPATLPRVLGERRRQSPDAACADCRSTQVFGKFAEAAVQ